MRQPVLLNNECIRHLDSVAAVANWFGRGDVLHTEYREYRVAVMVDRISGLLERWQKDVLPWVEAKER